MIDCTRMFNSAFNIRGYRFVKAVPKVAHKPTGNTVDLMAALRASVKNEGAKAPASKPNAKAHVGGAQLGSRFPSWHGNRMKTRV